jgi:hypothetical protein
MAEDAKTSFRMPVYGAVAGLGINLPILLFGKNPGPLFVSFLAAGIVAWVLLVVAAFRLRRQWFSAVCMLVIFVTLAWSLFRASDDVRTTGRWLFEARSYKARVLAAPAPQNGTLNHVEWDGWGFAGAGDTTVYVVYDPVNELAQFAANRSEGKFPGLPCPVVRVHKLENHWYTVLFYTDTDWNHCTADS